jgi:hypothetical protein
MPDAATTKEELLARIERARAEWERVLVLVGEARMDATVDAEGKTVKDMIAHVMAYERWTAGIIAAGVRGSEPTPQELYDADQPPPGFDTLDLDERNAAILAHYRDVPFTEIVASAERAITALVTAIEDLTEEQLSSPGAFPWTQGRPLLEILPAQSYEHYAAHLPELRAVAGNERRQRKRTQ